METAIRISPAPRDGEQRFLLVDVTGKSFRLCRTTGVQGGKVDYEIIATSTKSPAFRAFDWSPVNDGLVVVGQSSGEATLLKIDDDSQASVSFPVRNQRLCNAVALSSQNLLAAGLEKVRTDFCLNIWDVQQRLPAPGVKGFGAIKSYSDPLHKLASSEPITSLKFFHNDAHCLIAGVKSQCIRVYDLRDPSAAGALQFATRCVSNITVDGQDENYFASCSPVDNPTICVWDRRMASRSNLTTANSVSLNPVNPRPPEVSLELKRAIDAPGAIWSLRFSRTQQGTLGALSSTGQLRMYEFEKEFLTESDRSDLVQRYGPAWAQVCSEELYLNRCQDVERSYFYPSDKRDENRRIVSFDFLSNSPPFEQSSIFALTGDGTVKMLSFKTKLQPACFSSLGFMQWGNTEWKAAVPTTVDPVSKAALPGPTIKAIKTRAEPRNSLKQAFVQSRQKQKNVDLRQLSSYRNHLWNSDLGFYEKGASLEELLTLSSACRLRCEAGYLFSATKNKSLASDSHWVQSFWASIERAGRLSRSGSLTQDNIDLSYIGVYGLWMEDIAIKTRTLGPSSNKISKIIENLSRKLNITAGKGCPTEYAANRQLCLYVAGLAWTGAELDIATKRLISEKKHMKAAALAVFAGEKSLAYRALRSKTSTSHHRMLAMAIAGSSRREVGGQDNPEETAEIEDAWSETLAELANELTDPYARAILALVRTGDWHAVVEEESLPLKYRLGVALRWLSDSALTTYISKATKDAIARGDIEGIVLTGIGTNDSIRLMGNYIRIFGDLQTAVLSLSSAVPRYVDDPHLLREFSQWRAAYRQQMNSWGLKFDRVRFDIGSQKLAIDSSNRRLVEPVKPQVALVCVFCNQGLARFDKQNESTEKVTIHRTQKHPLTSEKAAAIGTVCPKCGRHLPRCGVCDMWLATPDPSHTSWYGQHKPGSVDLSASIAGSINTTIGPGAGPRQLAPASMFGGPQLNLNGEAMNDEQDASQMERAWGEMLKKLTVFCIKCSHGFHANHAKQWFGGYAGREGHKICPVSSCDCVCDT